MTCDVDDDADADADASRVSLLALRSSGVDGSAPCPRDAHLWMRAAWVAGATKERMAAKVAPSTWLKCSATLSSTASFILLALYEQKLPYVEACS